MSVKNEDRVLVKLDNLYRAIKHNVTTIQTSQSNQPVVDKAIKALRSKIDEYVDLVVVSITSDAIGSDPFLITTRGIPDFPLADKMIKDKLAALRAADPKIMTAVDIVEIKAAKEGGQTIAGKLKNGVKWRYDRAKNMLVLSYWLSKSYLSMAWTKVAQFVRQFIDWCKAVAKKDTKQVIAVPVEATVEKVVIDEPAMAVS